MSATKMAERGIEQAAQVRDVLDANPSLPVVLLTDSGPSDYPSYYHIGIEARVEPLLWPDVVEMQGRTFGLNTEKVYNDEDDAVDDVAEWLFEVWWDHAFEHGMRRVRIGDEAPDDVLTEFCGYEYDYDGEVSLGIMADYVAREIVADMPWQSYVVIRGWL
ncbi:MAG: hypothetical protein IKG22_16390 [Atopobiaceae bacterium]|nr:hypothetical protein [Atopobiaceae bacterium]